MPYFVWEQYQLPSYEDRLETVEPSKLRHWMSFHHGGNIEAF